MTGLIASGPKPSGGRGQLRHPDRGDAPDDDVVRGHVPLALDRPEPRLDLDEPCRRGGHRALQLGPTQPQHGAQFLGGDLLVQDLLDLLKGQAELFQSDDTVEAGELGSRVVPVAGGRVDMGRAQQSGGVVVTQHADRYAAVPGEVSDGEHDVSDFSA